MRNRWLECVEKVPEWFIFESIGVSGDLWRGFTGRVDGQKRWNGCPYWGIIDNVVCRSTDYEVKWQISAR